MKLSVLDQSPSAEGDTQDVAIRHSLALAQACDAIGYERYWLSEHHNSASIVGTAPEILMAAIAATTRRIRIGSAGVMLPHYSSLKVAEQFRVLEALAPGRIDLGLGRAPGSDRLTAQALNPYANAADEFPRQVVELMHWVEGRALPDSHPFASIAALPSGPTSPEVWILGSSNYGAQLAAHFGLPYAFAYFFTDGQGAELAMALYRDRFQPSERHREPQSTLCIWALAAESDEEAQRLALSRDRWRIDRQRGALGPLQSPEAIAARGFSDAEMAALAPMRAKAFVGAPATVGAKIRKLASDFALDEVVINTWAFDPAVRRRSYALLAQEFDLPASA